MGSGGSAASVALQKFAILKENLKDEIDLKKKTPLDLKYEENHHYCRAGAELRAGVKQKKTLLGGNGFLRRQNRTLQVKP